MQNYAKFPFKKPQISENLRGTVAQKGLGYNTPKILDFWVHRLMGPTGSPQSSALGPEKAAQNARNARNARVTSL